MIFSISREILGYLRILSISMADTLENIEYVYICKYIPETGKNIVNKVVVFYHNCMFVTGHGIDPYIIHSFNIKDIPLEQDEKIINGQ